MHDPLSSLTHTELLALALEAERRGDAAQALACLKASAARADAPADTLFLLGSEYAQLGLVDAGVASLERALAVAPHAALMRFQLGLLHLTRGDAVQATQVWAPLAELPPSDPQAAFLVPFHRALLHLIRDEFDDAARRLDEGLRANDRNAPLNDDMRRIADAIAPLAAAKAATAVTAVTGSATADEHLFLNRYKRGSLH